MEVVIFILILSPLFILNGINIILFVLSIFLPAKKCLKICKSFSPKRSNVQIVKSVGGHMGLLIDGVIIHKCGNFVGFGDDTDFFKIDSEYMVFPIDFPMRLHLNFCEPLFFIDYPSVWIARATIRKMSKKLERIYQPYEDVMNL